MLRIVHPLSELLFSFFSFSLFFLDAAIDGLKSNGLFLFFLFSFFFFS